MAKSILAFLAGLGTAELVILLRRRDRYNTEMLVCTRHKNITNLVLCTHARIYQVLFAKLLHNMKQS